MLVCKKNRHSAFQRYFLTILNMRAQEILNVFANHARGKAQYAVWKEQARGIPIRTEKAFRVKLNYIHMNPVRAGIVAAPDEYAFSSFRSIYHGEKGYLPVSFPEWWR
ncbi:MAG: hypothetical protein GY803_09205 [Chloroflexi bacterium]|nr:hypothetical protein [Chloroflexota bacterium]